MVLLMIIFTQGNLLDAEVEALVNTVNTVGVMGRGVALMFKEAFPENFEAYERASVAKSKLDRCLSRNAANFLAHDGLLIFRRRLTGDFHLG
jgi:hypothetical protein